MKLCPRPQSLGAESSRRILRFPHRSVLGYNTLHTGLLAQSRVWLRGSGCGLRLRPARARACALPCTCCVSLSAW